MLSACHSHESGNLAEQTKCLDSCFRRNDNFLVYYNMQKNGQLKKYLFLHQKYLNDAEELLEKGDYAQASEKLWGSTATLAKAIAAFKKKQIKSHDGITFFLTTISNELKDKNILNVILMVNGLHQNFYEDTLTPEAVMQGAKVVKQFSKRLRNYFGL